MGPCEAGKEMCPRQTITQWLTPVTLPSSSEGLVGADPVPEGLSPLVTLHARCPVELAPSTSSLSHGVRRCGPAQERWLGGPLTGVQSYHCTRWRICTTRRGTLPRPPTLSPLSWRCPVTHRPRGLLPDEGWHPASRTLLHGPVDDGNLAWGHTECRRAYWGHQRDFCALSQFSVFTDSCGVAVLFRSGFSGQAVVHPLLIDDSIHLWPTITHWNTPQCKFSVSEIDSLTVRFWGFNNPFCFESSVIKVSFQHW